MGTHCISLKFVVFNTNKDDYVPINSLDAAECLLSELDCDVDVPGFDSFVGGCIHKVLTNMSIGLSPDLDVFVSPPSTTGVLSCTNFDELVDDLIDDLKLNAEKWGDDWRDQVTEGIERLKSAAAKLEGFLSGR